MIKQYNKHIVFHDYKPGDWVWLKKKVFKPGESRKLAPRKTGPWRVLRKLPNGVNFEIEELKTKTIKIVHHNRLTPASAHPTETTPSSTKHSSQQPSTSEIHSVPKIGAPYTDLSDSEDDYETASENEHVDNPAEPRYPQRIRVPRVVDGAVPWSDVDDGLLDV